MRAKPIGECLRPACFDIGVVRAAECRNEDLRMADLTAGAVDHFGSLARVVDEALISGTMLKTHYRLSGVQEGTEVIAERAVLQAVGMLGFVLLPQQLPSCARPRQLSLDRPDLMLRCIQRIIYRGSHAEIPIPPVPFARERAAVREGQLATSACLSTGEYSRVEHVASGGGQRAEKEMNTRRDFVARMSAGMVSAVSVTKVIAKNQMQKSRSMRGIDGQSQITVQRRDDKITRHRVNGDIFPLTWLSDGRQFSSWSDGYGAASDTGSKYYNTKGVFLRNGPTDAVFEDMPGYPAPVRDLWSESSEPRALYYGISALALEGVIYHFLSCAQKNTEAGWGWEGVKVIYSTDLGSSWCNQDRSRPVVWEPYSGRSRESLLFYREPNNTFSLISYLQMGAEYRDNKDGYAYIYGMNGNTDGTMNQLVLARVRRPSLLDRDAYEFYVGQTRRGEAKWDPDIERRGILHTFPMGWVNRPKSGQNVVQSWVPSVVYNAPLGLYMMASSGVGCPSNGDWFADPKPSYVGLWIAQFPWGPWTQIYEETEWAPGGDSGARCYSPQISPKWIAPDGRSFWLIWSDLQSRCGASDAILLQRSMKDAVSPKERERVLEAHANRCYPYYAFNAQRFDLNL